MSNELLAIVIAASAATTLYKEEPITEGAPDWTEWREAFDYAMEALDSVLDVPLRITVAELKK